MRQKFSCKEEAIWRHTHSRKYRIADGFERVSHGEIDRKSGAGDGARTRDIKLGRLVLYQLSYSRIPGCYYLCPASEFIGPASQVGQQTC